MQSVRPETGTAHHRAIRVVVADDDPVMRRSIVDYLESNGVRAAAAAGRRDLARHISETNPDLVILDLQLDHESSLPLLGEIRSKSGGPAIIGIGRGREEIDRVVGLELGADDYLAKPFGLRELLARIRAILRGRDAPRTASQRAPERGRCRFGGWQLERRLRRLTDPQGTVVTLSKSEYALLVAFVEAPQRPLSREQLLQATRVHEDVFDRSVDVQVLRLRRKLEADPRDPQIIRTERGVGYVFTLPVEVQ
ncbi:winged helix-turn-helix domain-containing protein [Inquilinus limosus]|uniref:winged helix-turn-helix domain-containing protein n=1 Tax=Inquilinus limosus TaxID=171674 RepID=UPI00068CBE6F|nr:winged helix-turn-helix domain-containing protein [Inquilinus limosus]